MSPEISALTEGHIKSTGRVFVESLEFGETGPVNGRNWMVVDGDGKFMLSDRYPKMVWIESFISEPENVLVLSGRNFDRQLAVPITDDGKRRVVEMFDSSMRYEAVDDGEEAANWLGEFLDVDGVRLVHLPKDVVRKDGRGMARMGFADSWAGSLGSDSSLEYLSEKAGRQIPRERFGHDVWVNAEKPFIEDTWGEIRIGGRDGLSVAIVKPIERCARTLVKREAESWEELKKKDSEPLATLSKIRRAESGKTIFGQKLAHHWEGENKILRVGDGVDVLVYKAPPIIK